MRAEGIKEAKLWTIEYFFLFVLSLSYLYCLPLLRTGVILGITASEVRLYDLVFILTFIFIIGPKLNIVFHNFGNFSDAHRFLLYWLILAFIGLLVTFFLKESRFLIGIIRYVRLFSFAIVFVVGFMFIKNRVQVLFLFDATILCIAIISVIGSLQGFNIIPNLWPDYYAIYSDFEGGYLSTATLAPNHTHYSLIMAFGIVMVLTRFTISFRVSLVNIVFLLSLLPMIYSMIASRGRSGWLVMGVYFVLNFIISRNIKALVLTIFFVGGVFFLLDTDIEAGNSTVRDILLYRSINTSKELGRTALDVLDEEEKNWIERVDDNRWAIYESSIGYLFDNPQYLLFGAGFQNAMQGIGGVALAAHNAYINVVAEHGIIGLVIYLSFLFYLLRFAIAIRRSANNRISFIMAGNWICLYVGILAANFFGEVIYPGRALFTYLGSFFIIAVLFLHPAWRNPISLVKTPNS